MGLMRHLTTRSKRPLSTLLPLPTHPKGRPQISLPTELISTTNMLSYTAPPIPSFQHHGETGNPTASSSTASSRTSHSSGEDNDGSSIASAPSLSTDDSSLTSPSTPPSPTSPPGTANFYARATELADSTPAQTPAALDDLEDPFTTAPSAPLLPQRAPSHSKREHVRLARRRSQRTSLRALSTEHAPSSAPTHPFSQELEQLSEAAEDPSPPDHDANKHIDDACQATPSEEAKEDAADAAIMSQQGLSKWNVTAYLDDIAEMAGGRWEMFDA